jgi:hypothetical protein
MFEAKTKSGLTELAILGNPPKFAQPVPAGRPNVGDRQKLLTRINEMLDRNWLTNDGPYVREFEKRLSEFCGVKNCVAKECAIYRYFVASHMSSVSFLVSRFLSSGCWLSPRVELMM